MEAAENSIGDGKIDAAAEAALGAALGSAAALAQAQAEEGSGSAGQGAIVAADTQQQLASAESPAALATAVAKSEAKRSRSPARRPAQALPSGHYPPIDPPIATIIARGMANYPAIVPRRRKASPPDFGSLDPMESHPAGPGRAMCMGELQEGDSLYVGPVLAGQPQTKEGLPGREYLLGVPAQTPTGCFLSYEGDWNKGRMTGRGTIHYLSGEAYTGEVLDGMRHGQGRLNYVNGDVYEGQWEAGLRNGSGKLTWAASGNVFVGRFVRDVRQGPGTFYMVSAGKKLLAEYVDNEARCGVWEDISAEELAALTGHEPVEMLSSLAASKRLVPALELDAPFEVIAARVQQLRKAHGDGPRSRAASRACSPAPEPAAVVHPPSAPGSRPGSRGPLSRAQRQQAVRPGTAPSNGIWDQQPLSALELEALRLAAGWEVAGGVGGCPRGAVVLGEVQLRRVQDKLAQLLGGEDSFRARAVVGTFIGRTQAGPSEAAGSQDGFASGITFDQLLAAACGCRL